MKPSVTAIGVPKGASDDRLKKTIQDVFLTVTDNAKWLKKGQTVFLKPALNSHYPYPATTHPLALRAVAELLLARGAKVIAADQSGVEHVLAGPRGVVRGDSGDMYARSGMAASGVRFVPLESRGWDAGFCHKKAPSWEEGYHISSLVDEADHIINLPRVSTHVQAGVTLGFKNMVGLLREDSRMAFHAAGPFAAVIGHKGKQAGLRTDYPRTRFFEKIVEIMIAVAPKLRVTLFVGTAAQVTLGPDTYMAHMGGRGYVKSGVVVPDVGLVFGSADPVAAETFAIAYLAHLTPQTSLANRMLQSVISRINGRPAFPTRVPPRAHPFVIHGLELGLGSADFDIDFRQVPDSMITDLRRRI